MYKYGAADLIFEGVSNMYLISIATAFLAVILAFYYSNFLKNENEVQLKKECNNEEDENEGFDNYLNDSLSELGKRYQINKDFTIEGDYEDNDMNTKMHSGRSSSSNESSDIDCNTDEIHIEGIVGKLKSKRVKDLEAQLTRDQLEEEKRIEREQLAAIFELLKKQEAELNMKEIDETELSAQLALYR